ncbi:hypothetical protein NEFER03_0770 [Nematocida sp. LUAm3]|nr:hypothetical protein NEFER03_0770 [Nematocida sp. LUAm3]KAI5175229.1 hypothetical protein NEFER02_1190 [Nematocida sp. LUAm2]KAI5178099.1 hypothetical protein NEFER01_1277 [Nematocida sp. LUAm1]
MNIQKLFEEVKQKDTFGVFWRYPEDKNLSILSERISYIKSAKELKYAVYQICSLVFEKNEEGSFLYTEAQNLLHFSEAVIDKAISAASVTGSYLDISSVREEKDTNKFVAWENSVIHKLCERYESSLLLFTRNIRLPEVKAHTEYVLYCTHANSTLHNNTSTNTSNNTSNTSANTSANCAMEPSHAV